MSHSTKYDTSKVAFTRIFVLGGKGFAEHDWRKHFSPFGRINNVWITTDRNTGREKGITYITFEKTSQSCKAQEEMNGKRFDGQEKPIKVIISAERGMQLKSGVEEEDMLKKLFVMFPLEMSESDLREEFKEYGEIDYIRLVKAKKANAKRNLAYVKFYKQSSAAKAYEECDPDYKPIFADIRTMEELERDGHFDDLRGGMEYDRSRRRPMSGDYEDRYGSRYDDFRDRRNGSGATRMNMGVSPLDIVKESQRGVTGSSVIEVCVSGRVSENHVRRLCDVVPGMVHYECDAASGIAYVTYASPSCATYAVQKLSNFEYPIGCPLSVKLQGGGSYGGGDFSSAASQLNSSMQGFSASNMAEGGVQALVDSISKATVVLQQAGISGVSSVSGSSFDGGASVGKEYVPWCNVPLPYKKPFAAREAPLEQRLFIVSTSAFPDRYLEEAFCRFGDLITAYFMPGKGFGYAKYANKESANEAIKVLHGQQICGNRVKVMEAEPHPYADQDYGREPKRMRDGYD